MTNGQDIAFRLALAAIADECRTSAVGNLLENHLKVVVVERLLRAGYTVMEGTARAGHGKLISLRGDKLTSTLVPRVSKTTSPDIRVTDPVQLVLELQARSVFGTQDTLFSGNVVDDLERIRDGRADGFILAADRAIYDPLRGLKTDSRGRKALAPGLFAVVLPASVACEEGVVLTCLSPSSEFSCRIARVVSPFGTERIVLGVARCS